MTRYRTLTNAKTQDITGVEFIRGGVAHEIREGADGPVEDTVTQLQRRVEQIVVNSVERIAINQYE